ncbi:MAG TPA: ATP-binding protein [Polyangiaceae bacterium]|nr:ATP-binding protein [Polyangiaceae bacterium]
MSASARSASLGRSSTYAALERVSRQHIGFAWGALTNVLTTSIAYAIAPYAQLAHLMIIHLLGAVLISTRYGMLISTVTAITGALAFDYFCIPPIFAFALPDPHSVATFAGIMLVALLVCWLNQGVRLQRAAAHASEARTRALCELSLDLSRVTSQKELSGRAEQHLGKLFGGEARVVLGKIALKAGASTQPIRIGDDEVGQIVIGSDQLPHGKAAERRLLLAACADHVADALQRLTLTEAAQRAKLDADLERNRNALLSAVSHDMKTPLASILTAGTSLLSAAKHDERSSAVSRDLLETIVQEAERMNDLITNLLSVTRLESGAAALNKAPEALDDLVFGVLSRFSGRFEGRRVAVDAPSDLPLVQVDPVLCDQVLVNLLENVLRYTPQRSPIDICIRQVPAAVEVDVCDRGPGFLPAEREKVFDKFYRGAAAGRNDGGTGLGLTICRAVARAHGGDMFIFSREGGGAIVRFSLPYTAAPPHLGFGESRRLEA